MKVAEGAIKQVRVDPKDSKVRATKEDGMVKIDAKDAKKDDTATVKVIGTKGEATIEVRVVK